MVYANATKQKLSVKHAGKSYRLKPGEKITFHELDFDDDIFELISSGQLVPISTEIDLTDFSFNDLDIKPQIDIINPIENQFLNIKLKQTTD